MAAALLQHWCCSDEDGRDFRQLLFERLVGGVDPGLAQCRMQSGLDR
jgi:hypothetical protein